MNPSIPWMTAEQDRSLVEAITRESTRLRRFIRRRVSNEGDADDILQEVFYELVEAYRLMKPIEQLSAWLFRVARNRITDRFRRRKPDASLDERLTEEGDDETTWQDLLPSPTAGPEAEFARRVLLDEIEAALAELPAAQRDVFIAHEFERRSFKELSEETGVGVNTLLSRKHSAVLHLRKRLTGIYEEFGDARGRTP
jgi:RNA polymerase sigma factor (sigma-70 family)